jgi:hypothetical protein
MVRIACASAERRRCSARDSAGVSHVVIQVMGRWDSSAYEVYCRWERRNVRRLGAAVASTTFEDYDGGYGDEELVVQPNGNADHGSGA